jgi:CheY-like chemotaxis protein
MPTTVLICDRHADAMICSELLPAAFEDLRLIHATGVDEALAILRTVKVDVVHTVLTLRDMSGVDIARRVRSEPDFERNKDASVVAVLSSGVVQDEAALRAAGFTAWTQVAFDVMRYLNTMADVLQKPWSLC